MIRPGCPRRSCASLPRRPATAAEVAALRDDIEALDHGLRDADGIAELALGRANALGRVLAEHLSPAALKAAAGQVVPLRSARAGTPGAPQPAAGSVVPLRSIRGGGAA